MSSSQHAYVLICPQCQERTVLPHRNLRGKSLGQYYWPTDAATLTLVCQGRGHLSVHSESDVHLEDAPTPAPNLPPSVFWLVEFLCDQGSCDLPIAVHITTEEGLSHGAIGKLVFDSTPKPTCANGHRLSPQQHVRELERIEWTGEDEYLT
jgi:hypothetical protein